MGDRRVQQKKNTIVEAAVVRKLFWFGQQLRSFRVERGLGQPEFGRLLGLADGSKSSVSILENGKRGLSFSAMVKMAHVLGYDLQVTLKPLPRVDPAVGHKVSVKETSKEEGQKGQQPTEVKKVEAEKKQPEPVAAVDDIPSND